MKKILKIFITTFILSIIGLFVVVYNTSLADDIDYGSFSNSIDYGSFSNPSSIDYGSFSNPSSIDYGSFSNPSSIDYGSFSNPSSIDYGSFSNPSSIDYGSFSNITTPIQSTAYLPGYTQGAYPGYGGYNYGNQYSLGLGFSTGNYYRPSSYYIPSVYTVGGSSAPSYNYYVNNNTPTYTAPTPTTWCQYTNSYLYSYQACTNPCTYNQYWNGSYCVNNYSQYCSINGQTYYNQSDYNNYCKQNTIWCQYTNSYIYSYQSCTNPCTYNQYWNGSYCVNNNPILQVTTNSATNITTNTAICNGSVYNSNNNYLSGYFEYGQNQGSTITTNVINMGNNTNTQYTGNLVNLSPNTTYYCRAVAVNNNGNKVYGSWVSFNTNIAYKPVVKTPKAKPVTKVVYVPTPAKKVEKKKDCDEDITTIKLKTNKDNKVALSINGQDLDNRENNQNQNIQTPAYYNNAMAQQQMANPYNPYMNNNGYNNNPYNNTNDNTDTSNDDDSVVPNTLLGWLGFIIMIIVLMLLVKHIKDKYSNQNTHNTH